VTRIIAGTAGGRRLRTAPGTATRPTSDVAREGLFASIGTLAGWAVLDLYAGSGAVGLEALSRGAGDVVLVESDRRAAGIIRHNIAALGLSGAVLIIGAVDRVLRRGPGSLARRRLVFADPPYAAPAAEVAAMLTALAGRGWLAPDALVVLERDARSGPPPWPPPYAPGRSRRYGETVLWYGTVPAEPKDQTGA
jgi:16S rRNA (guanine966-N2)-methyltransferase